MKEVLETRYSGDDEVELLMERIAKWLKENNFDNFDKLIVEIVR